MAGLIGKGLSALIAVSASMYAYSSLGDGAALKCAMFFVFPLALIWFPEEMAGFTGSIGGQSISETSPPGCVYAGGWVMLFLPLIMAAIVWMRT